MDIKMKNATEYDVIRFLVNEAEQREKDISKFNEKYGADSCCGVYFENGEQKYEVRKSKALIAQNMHIIRRLALKIKQRSE
jgi:hypothetical protein